MATALPAAEHPSKTQTLRLVGDSGHLAQVRACLLPVRRAGAGLAWRVWTLSHAHPRAPQVGRKPTGVYADECAKTYRKTGLRDVWIRT